MKQNNAGCFTAAVVGMSRFIVLFAWIARPIAFDAAFYGSWIIPMPWCNDPALHDLDVPDPDNEPGGEITYPGPTGSGSLLAVVVDLAGAAAAAAQNRNRVPQGYPGALPPNRPPLLLQHPQLIQIRYQRVWISGLFYLKSVIRVFRVPAELAGWKARSSRECARR